MASRLMIKELNSSENVTKSWKKQHHLICNNNQENKFLERGQPKTAEGNWSTLEWLEQEIDAGCRHARCSDSAPSSGLCLAHILHSSSTGGQYLSMCKNRNHVCAIHSLSISGGIRLASSSGTLNGGNEGPYVKRSNLEKKTTHH